ncbi:hypothetical protein [Tabrizicola sp. BL-A-41-H6]|uniref:hypothetical protein n=1 Tax=Tabrizicola sp. BL-A-41-H6 TaxID=3421107 RepID=UPI003D67304C
MSLEIAVQDRIEPITVADGRILDERQTLAVLLHVREGLTGDKLAKAAGYSSQATVMGFLRSNLGRMGVQVAARTVLADASAIGVRVTIELAQKAKSEKVRLDAAIALMDRAGLAPQPQGQSQAIGNKGGISINIVMPGQTAEGQALDITPDQG